MTTIRNIFEILDKYLNLTNTLRNPTLRITFLFLIIILTSKKLYKKLIKNKGFRVIFLMAETFIKIFSKLLHKKMLMENFNIYIR